MKDLFFRELRPEEIPYDLLHLADPCREAVKDYLSRGSCTGGFADGVLVGQYVLLPTRPFTVELVNVAVREPWQHQGIGRKIVAHAVASAQKRGFKTVEVGTAAVAVTHVAFYQKCGFTIIHVDFDFFIRHYPELMYADGLRLRDMIRMKRDLE
ncbi:MAG: GNAT family N-acetyltransferase [Rikenellaceae bacterium]|nr:GNAT family N-acetyltransferase [Rikenellaceae bacterium]